MKNAETTYAKIVRLKKRLIRKQIIPKSIGRYIDTFFNSLHNIRIQTKDITRDKLIKSKDIIRDTAIRSKDLARDKASNLERVAKYNLLFYIREAFSLIPYSITEKSDKEAVGYMQKIVANSENVRTRIQKYYKRDAVVIHPPVEENNHKNKQGYRPTDNFIQSEQFWLSVNRVTPEKRVDIQVEAFRNLPGKKLIIVGGHDMNSRHLVSKIFHDCPPNVEYLDAVDHQTLISLYNRCFGLITTALDEDFGMNVVEALSFGKPVIAPNEGGYKETMIHKETGLLVDDIDAEKLSEAVRAVHRNVENGRSYNEACRQRASIFSEQIFIKNIKQEIERDTYRSKDKRLVFIVGVPRSGTTWLWGLLTSHPDIEAIVKSDFPTRANLTERQKDSIETNMLFDHNLKEISSVLDNKIKPIIIEKTPDHLLKIGSILSQFPNAKIIHIMRNPLSVFASYKYSDWDRKITEVEEWLPVYKKRIDQYVKYKYDARIFTVRYEDLHQCPRKTLRTVLDFIGAKKAPIDNMIRENKKVSKSTGSHAIRRAEIDTWKQELDANEIAKIQQGLSSYKILRKYLRAPFWQRLRERLPLSLYSEQANNFHNKKLVFIVGVPRSGTTWLWKLLSEHEDVDTLTLYDFKKEKPGKKDYVLKETNMLFDFSIRTIKNAVARKGKAIVIEKTPMHITKLDLIANEFPSAKIIHIIRDPLSVYASYKFTEYNDWNHKGIGVENWVHLYKKMFYTFIDKLDNQNILTIRYEDMLADTKISLLKIYNFLRLNPYNIDQATESSTYEKMFPVIHKLRTVNSLASKLTGEEIEYIRTNLKEEIKILNKIK